MSQTYSANQTQHSPSNYATHANFVYSAAYTNAVLGLLDAKPGEKIIDLGCGTGELTEQIRGIVGDGGVVVGVDSNEEMLAKAKSTASPGTITYIQADIQRLPELLDESHKGAYDAVFSSAVFHWCKDDPEGVVKGIKWLLKDGGRVAFEFGGFGCLTGVRSVLHMVLKTRGVDPAPIDPFYFPTANQYAKLLKAHNLEPTTIGLYPRPTPLPSNIKGWLTTFTRGSMLKQFDDKTADEIMEEVQEICRIDGYWKDEPDENGNIKDGWEVAYVRLRGQAVLKV